MIKKTFILIHGSWHSAWNWFKVTPILERLGHTVYPIDLPGMGRDKTPIEAVTFESTIDKLCQLIDQIDSKITLVGHSKNGVIISQLAEKRPHKIERLVYLAAVLAANGKCAKDYFELDKGDVLGPFIQRHSESNSTTLDFKIYKEGLYHDCENSITDLAKILLSHEPYESALAKIELTNERYEQVPRYYIECTEDKAITPYLQQKMYTEMPCKKVYQLKASHSPFFSIPNHLCDLLIEISEDE